MPLLDDPSPLVDALGRMPHTLVHGDWKAANLGSHPDGRTVLLDFGEVPGEASPMADLSWYLALNAALLPEPKDAVLERYRHALGRRGFHRRVVGRCRRPRVPRLHGAVRLGEGVRGRGTSCPGGRSGCSGGRAAWPRTWPNRAALRRRGAVTMRTGPPQTPGPMLALPPASASARLAEALGRPRRWPPRLHPGDVVNPRSRASTSSESDGRPARRRAMAPSSRACSSWRGTPSVAASSARSAAPVVAASKSDVTRSSRAWSSRRRS